MVLVVVLVGVGIAIGGGTTGGDLVTPIVGSLVLVFYGGALIGIGCGVGGLIGTRFAAPVTVVVVLLTWFVQLLGPLLGLPDIVVQLALTNHYGQPMVGIWDWGGVAVSAAIAVAGIALGAWGLRRRDLRA
jgi:putative exporter of polyketide antibiotics